MLDPDVLLSEWLQDGMMNSCSRQVRTAATVSGQSNSLSRRPVLQCLTVSLEMDFWGSFLLQLIFVQLIYPHTRHCALILEGGIEHTGIL